jgi:sugar phosphate isomerase/epimerase
MSLSIEGTNQAVIEIGYRSPTLTGNLTYKEKMALAQELGMRYIEPQLVEREFPDDDSFREYRETADEYGIGIRTAGGFPALTDPAEEDKIPTFFADVSAKLKTLGAGYLFVCARWAPEGIPQSETWDLLVRNMKAALEILSDAGIRLAIEPEWFIGSAERVVRLLESVDDDALMVNYDPTNLYLNGSDPLPLIDGFGDRICSGHIKDGIYRTERKGEVPVGTGEIEYEEIFDRLLTLQKPVTMFIEHSKTAEEVKGAVKYLRRFIEVD